MIERVTAALIRPAQQSDQSAIAVLWQDMIAELTNRDPDQPRPLTDAAATYAARLMAVLDAPDTCVLVAALNDQVIGYGLGALVDLQSDLFVPVKSGFIVDLSVARTARRQGVGRALISGLLGWFSRHRVTTVEWNVASTNKAGHVFWQAVGGRDVQVRMRVDLPNAKEQTDRQADNRQAGKGLITP